MLVSQALDDFSLVRMSRSDFQVLLADKNVDWQLLDQGV
jgi:hypothetical protein